MLPITTHNEVKELLDIFNQTDTPLMIHGTMGIGKSELARQWGEAQAEKNKLIFSDSVKDYGSKEHFSFIIINMQHFDAVDLKGIPIIENGSTRFIPTNMLPDSGQGVIFFDELNLAVPMVLNACYQIFLDRKILDKVVPKEFMLIGAGNLADDGANTFDIPAPLKDRMAHVQLGVPSVKEWVSNFAIPKGVDSRVITYLLASEDKLHTYKPESDEILFTTPRSWKKVSDNLDLVSDKLMERVASSLIGVGIAREFRAFIELSESYDIDAIFKGGEFKTPKELDRKYAFISAVTSYYKKHKDDNKILKRLVEIAGKFDSEYKMVIYHICTQFDAELFDKIEDILPEEEYEELFDKIIDMTI